LVEVEIGELLIRVEAPVTETPPDSPSRKLTVTEPSEQPSTSRPETLRRTPTAEPPKIEVAAIQLEFEAAAVAGANTSDQPPRFLSNPFPSYPPEALLAGIYERRVLLRVRVAEDGTVKSVVVDKSSGWQSMDDEAVRTIRRWRFEPARRRGIPIEFEFRF